MAGARYAYLNTRVSILVGRLVPLERFQSLIEQGAADAAEWGDIARRLSGQPLNLTEAQAKTRNINLEFFVIGEWNNKIATERRQQVFNELWGLFTEKQLFIPVAATYPLTEFKEDVKLAESPEVKVKVLLSS